MTTIEVGVFNNDLVITNMPKIASGSQQSIKMKFDFNSDWDGYSKIAVFYRHEKDAYNVVIDSNNECTIPDEVLRDKGFFWFGVFGVSGVIRKVSERLKYDVEKGSFVEGSEPEEPTPDIYEQLFTCYGQVLNQYQKISYENANILNQTERAITKVNSYETNLEAFKNGVQKKIQLEIDSSGRVPLRYVGLYSIIYHSANTLKLETLTFYFDRSAMENYSTLQYRVDRNDQFGIIGSDTINYLESNVQSLTIKEAQVFTYYEDSDVEAIEGNANLEIGVNETNNIINDKFEIENANYKTITWESSKLLKSNGEVIDYTSQNGIDVYFVVSNFIEVEPFTRLHINYALWTFIVCFL